MSLYTLRNLVNDCSTRLARTKCAVDKKKDTLEEIWRAFNDWIESRFEHGKGVHIATFGSIGWETCTNSRNQPKLRPVFVLSNTYIKTYGLLQRKNGPSSTVNPLMSSLEEINFTKIAIKFSRNLTKDLVFAGLRDMLQKIGEIASSGAAVSIAFHFGKLIAKNRYVTMLFDPLKFPRALEDDIARSMMSSPASVLGNLADFDVAAEVEEDAVVFASSGSVVDMPLTERRRQDKDKDKDLDHGSQTSRTAREVCLQLPSEQDQQEAEQTRENMPTNRCDPSNLVHSETDKFEMSLEEELKLFDDNISPSRQSAVMEDAFKRHIAALAEQVDREAKYAFDLQLQQKRDLETVALEKKMRRLCAEDLQRHLKLQIDAKAQQQLAQRQQEGGRNPYDTTTTAVGSPTGSSSIACAGVHSIGKQDVVEDSKDKQLQARNQLKQQLEEQINLKVQERLNEKQKQLNDDKIFLKRLRNEMNAIEAKEAVEREERKKNLTQAWQRDAMMRKLVEQKKKQRAAEQIHRQGIAIEPAKTDFYPRLPQPMTPTNAALVRANSGRTSVVNGNNASGNAQPKAPAKSPHQSFLPSPQQQRRIQCNVPSDTRPRDREDDDYSVGFDIRSVDGG